MSLFLIRHASAGTRGFYNGDDLERPLDDDGIAQASAIAERLSDVGITQVLSSAAVRCVQTVEPLADTLELTVEVESALLEGQTAEAAIHRLRELARSNTSAALCSHGDIIPDAIQTLAREGLVIIGTRGWAKGSTWKIEQRGSDLVSAEFLGPF